MSISYEQLIAYAAGDLSAIDAAAVEAHLAADPRAAETVRLYRATAESASSPIFAEPPAGAMSRAKAIAGLAPAGASKGAEREPWWQAVHRVVAQVVFDSRCQLSLAGLRGHERGFQLSFGSEPVCVDVQAEPLIGLDGFGDGEPLLHWSVVGQIEMDLLEPGCPVALVRRGARMATAQALADRHGMFSMQAPAGRYDLHIRSARGVVILPDIDMA